MPTDDAPLTDGEVAEVQVRWCEECTEIIDRYVEKHFDFWNHYDRDEEHHQIRCDYEASNGHMRQARERERRLARDLQRARELLRAVLSVTPHLHSDIRKEERMWRGE